MKYIFSYGLWMAAIASYVLLFTRPTHIYISYANNIITIYEMIAWLLFVIFSVVLLILGLAKLSGKDIRATGSSADFTKALEKISVEKLHMLFLRYVHYAFIIFVGVFVGDISMTLILTLNSILLLLFRKLLKSLLKELSYERL